MKKIIISSLIGFLFVGCTRDDINTDPNSAYITIPSTLVTNAQKELSDYVTTCSVNENNFRLTMQYWTETIYVDESNYNFQKRNVPDQIFIDNYVNVLNNLVKSKKLINEYVPIAAEASTWPGVKQNQLALIDILQVYTYQNLVDTFGNIPYSQSNQLTTTPAPAYDDAATIYGDLISRLRTDIANINTAAGLNSNSDKFATADLYYAGNLSSWKIFGNSLLLKLGIAIADSNPTLAQQTVNTAIQSGVMTSAANNCQLKYLTASGNWNPVYENVDSNASGRPLDFIAGKTIIDYMNNSSDLRIAKYFQPVNDAYVGQTIGAPGSPNLFSNPGAFAYTATTPGILLNYTEVAFYLAEAASRWAPSTAAAAYTNAVTASFLEWGLTTADATTYLATKPYDPTNWKKSIGEQAWVAMYNQPLTSWNFWRRLDNPVLIAPSTASPLTSVPVRMRYPVSETTTNGANYSAASAAIGGDLYTTKIFWDKF